jgi:hypothetical protein
MKIFDFEIGKNRWRVLVSDNIEVSKSIGERKPGTMRSAMV